jgi:hypothetical protein
MVRVIGNGWNPTPALMISSDVLKNWEKRFAVWRDVESSHTSKPVGVENIYLFGSYSRNYNFEKLSWVYSKQSIYKSYVGNCSDPLNADTMVYLLLLQMPLASHFQKLPTVL